MPRIRRCVVAQVPHHVTQRGNRREPVFFSDSDRRFYLSMLQAYAGRHGVEIVAYCLMPNHVHLVAVPSADDSLQATLKPVHMRHAQRINRARGWKGHLWQGRYFSSPLDQAYFWAAIRYVERNPVRAGMVRVAEDYPWSSARAHCGGSPDSVLTCQLPWTQALTSIGNWSQWLSDAGDIAQLEILRRNADKGIPCGSEAFVRSMEERTGRALRYRPQGRESLGDAKG